MKYTDQMGNEVELDDFPQRIISLVPSQTELLFDLGLGERVVGRTRFCIAPEGRVENAMICGGTKQFNFENIRKLNPDLIIGNKEENYQEGIAALKKEFPVWMSDINDLDDAIEMIREVGRLCGVKAEADALVEEIAANFSALTQGPTIKAAYLIWKKPWMAAGGETFIDDMLSRSGFQNIFSHISRYPKIAEDDLEKAQVILLSSEPYPFGDRETGELKTRFPGKIVLQVDGRTFSWYGSRLRSAPDYFNLLRDRIDRKL